MNKRLYRYLRGVDNFCWNTSPGIYGTSKEYCLRGVMSKLVGKAIMLPDGDIAFELPTGRLVVSQDELLETAEMVTFWEWRGAFVDWDGEYLSLRHGYSSGRRKPFKNKRRRRKPLEVCREAAIAYMTGEEWHGGYETMREEYQEAWEVAQDILRKAKLTLPIQRVCGQGWPWREVEGGWTPETPFNKGCEFFPELGVILFQDVQLEGDYANYEEFGLQLCFCYGAYYGWKSKEYYSGLVDAQLKKYGEASIRELLNIIVAPLKCIEISEMVDTRAIDKLKPFITTYLLGFNLYRKGIAQQLDWQGEKVELYFDIASLTPEQLDALNAFEFPVMPEAKPKRKVISTRGKEAKERLTKTICDIVQESGKTGIKMSGVLSAVDASVGAVRQILNTCPLISREGDKGTARYFYKPL